MNSVRPGFGPRVFPAALIAVVIAFGFYLDHAASFEVLKESAMTIRNPASQDDPTQAKHGPRSEVTWEGGSGRQPYANRGNEEAAEPNAGDDEVAEGNRSDRSGVNHDQLAEARRKP
jgi:hypothetical protein